MLSPSPRSQALAPLEWPRFLALAEAEARTAPGKAKLAELGDPGKWAQSVAEARHLQAETHEAAQLLARDSLWGVLQDLADPAETLESLGRGAVLELADLASLRRWLAATDAWVQMRDEEIPGIHFQRALTTLHDPRDPLRELNAILTPEGELSERATPRLAQLYQEIRALKREIGIVLDQLLKTFAQKGVLQEAFSDVRDGRYVIPVKISSQGEVDGIIYESSVSRQTVFVEPREVAQLNNRLRQRNNDLLQEIFEILEAAAKKLRPHSGDIAQAVATIAHWDAVQAKARLAVSYAGRALEVTEEREFELVDTTHPLLYWALAPEKIIHNEIRIQSPTRALLITGPNTGGKTVFLKTLGLAGICARTGFFFPAHGAPKVPYFSSFFADLGDAQSIQEHTSSFSGHIQRFKEILEQVTDRSLVLLDELNTATDPEEGAALGRAVLEKTLERGALIVTTTHDPHLKALALNDPRIMNASMAFDESARIPTYRIVLGVPGRSRALETAERLGIPAAVLALARSYLTQEHNQFESMLAKLERDSREAEWARGEATKLREEAERLRRDWTERTERSVSEVLERTRQKLRQVLEIAQEQVRASVRKLDEARSRKDIDETRAGLNAALAGAEALLQSAVEAEVPELAKRAAAREEPAAAAARAELKVGDTVRIPKWKSTGTVTELSAHKAKVLVGKVQMSLDLAEVEFISSAPPKRAPQRLQDAAVAAPPREIDLRGVRFEEAMAELGAYLDRAFRSRAYVEVNIVHGLGTGAIREGARQMLAKLPYVKSFRDGGAGGGGSGATVVEFER